MDTTLFVKNGPCMASLGLGGEGYLSFSIATPTGEGVTTPLTFTRERRCSLIDDLAGSSGKAVSERTVTMQLGLVIGTATATVKHPTLRGLEAAGRAAAAADGSAPDGEPVLAVDRLGAGGGERVMITSDGKATRELIGSEQHAGPLERDGDRGCMSLSEADIERIVREVMRRLAA